MRKCLVFDIAYWEMHDLLDWKLVVWFFGFMRKLSGYTNIDVVRTSFGVWEPYIDQPMVQF